jgi:nicotinamide mononucleotide transporter
MPNYLSVETIFFTVLGYSVSYVEFFGTVLYFASVWLIAKKNSLTWPIGIISVILYFALFYQFQLYSDALEQIYYLFASGYGWWAWNRVQKSGDGLPSGFSKKSVIVIWASCNLVVGLALGFIMSNIHHWLPSLFPVAASYAYLDAVTTIMSFSAMWLLTLRRAESWVYWIIVDIAAIYLYFTKGIAFVGLQYIALTGIAIYGLLNWYRLRDGLIINSRNNSQTT